MNTGSTWIFGYGSLVWRPDIPFVEQRPAWVDGWARRFWQASPDHRGVPEQPGRVVTMLRWPTNRCWGRAYRLPDAEREAILGRLDHREKAGYQREELPLCGVEGQVFAHGLTWVATPSNPNYLGLASLEAMASQIDAAHGPSGSNREYVLKLAAALREIGVEDDQTFELERILLAL